VTVSLPPLSAFVKHAKELRMLHSPEPNSLIFWGAMNRKENEEAVLEFHRNVFAGLLARGKKYRLYIAGSNPTDRIKQLASDHVVVTGFIEDPSELFSRMAIGIVPLTMGAGVKLKTMELVEAGIPVVSTPVGAEGLSYADSLLMIRDISNFGKTLDELYRDSVTETQRRID
jgi:glycosyltransferase involved in cell wall biosynthesis